MNVLIGCEYSGIVREAFARLGHYAVSCDLLPTERPCGPNSAHHQGDIIEFIRRTRGQWDLFIVFPDCTFLCSSGLHWNKNPNSVRYGGAQTEEALRFVLMLLEAPVPRVALENPMGCISTRIRKATQYVQPHDYGDDASKKTGLWLKNLPPLVADPAKRVPGRIVEYEGKMVERWSNQTDSGQNKLAPSEDRWKDRSRTYQGIADAMAAHWGALPALATGNPFLAPAPRVIVNPFERKVA